MDLIQKEKFNSILSDWYKRNKREFPWRKTNTTLYKIFIAEILLRKTNAEMVSKFFPIFIKKYPTFNSIKRISQNELENDLIPLGLYKNRANLLKKVVYDLEIKYRGQIPDQFDKLIDLYGIGKYIANAILCFGFNKKVILVDTNINRIFSRITNKEYPKKVNDNHPLWKELELIIQNKDYKTFFMAIIDFGALVCKKKNYNCNECPFSDLCKYINKKLIS